MSDSGQNKDHLNDKWGITPASMSWAWFECTMEKGGGRESNSSDSLLCLSNPLFEHLSPLCSSVPVYTAPQVPTTLLRYTPGSQVVMVLQAIEKQVGTVVSRNRADT